MLAAVRSLTIPVISAFIPLVALADANYCNSRDDLVWDAGTQTCENKLSIFTGELRVLTDPIVAKPAASGLTDSAGRYLHEIEGGFRLEFSLTNASSAPRQISLRQTPLSSDLITSNFFGPSPDLYHSGIIAEYEGTLDEYVTLPPGEKLNQVLDFGTVTQIAKTTGEVQVEIGFELRLLEQDSGRIVSIPLRTAAPYAVAVRPGAKIIIPGRPESAASSLPATPRTASVTTASSSVKISTAEYPGVPYWNYVCEDVSADMTGYTYADGTPAPCSVLGAYCGDLETACPVSCGTCATANASWTTPWSDKSYETAACDADEISVLSQADSVKNDFCASALYCLESKTTACEDLVQRWFGGRSDDADEWATLRTGFAKICSASDYDYQCAPTDNCAITFSYDGNDYNNVEQSSVPANVRDGFIEQCQSSGCAYSATVAWVLSSDIDNKEMNLCPIGFWIQSEAASEQLSSKASVIVHELSHFVSIAGTDDMTYDTNLQLNTALTNPWYYLPNASTWDNFSEDYTTEYTWSDFSELNNVDDALSPGVLWFLTRGSVAVDEEE